MCSEARTLGLVVLALCVAACGGAAQHPKTEVDLSPASLYPLAVGYAWSYDVDGGDGAQVLVVARVTALQDGVAELQNGSETVLRYGLTPDGITHAEKGGHLLKAPIAQDATWPSGPNTSAMVSGMHTQITTPAGTFNDCVVVSEQNRDNGQRIETTYCPGVGPAQVVSEMDVRGKLMRVTATLRGYNVSPE